MRSRRPVTVSSLSNSEFRVLFQPGSDPADGVQDGGSVGRDPFEVEHHRLFKVLQPADQLSFAASVLERPTQTMLILERLP